MEGDFERRAGAIADVQSERDRQIRKGWTSEHDDERTKIEWSWIIGLRVNDLLDPSVESLDARQLLVEIAAIAVAGIEQIDRQGVRLLGEAFGTPVGVTDVTDPIVTDSAIEETRALRETCPACGSEWGNVLNDACRINFNGPDRWHTLTSRYV